MIKDVPSKIKILFSEQSLCHRQNLILTTAMFCGRPGIFFKYGDLECVINNCFNIVLYSEFTVWNGSSFEPIGFVVPVHYQSFVKTIDKRFDLATDPCKIFQFDDESAIPLLLKFISTEKKCSKYSILSDLLGRSKK